ncbi:MAG TPA: hypothetical protein PK974_01965 [Rhodocyclaceae bacterium]|nr:hypothetical protein [Rhodocyclaceae bacterium]
MTQSSFSFHETSRQALEDRIAGFSPSIAKKFVPATNDRWVLASNLQKCIRRGLAESAVATTTKLLTVDASYCWRRLLVIGYEDIGLANPALVHELLRTFRREAVHRELGPERVAGYFAHALATSRKSRALCDAIAALEFSVRRDEYEQPCFGMTDQQLVATACDTSALSLNRIAAMRHVAGYRIAERGSYRTATPARTELMREIAGRMGLTEIETRLYQSGQNCSESMNVGLPLVAEVVRGVKDEHQLDLAFSGKHGILYAALDRHTRAGKRCLAKLSEDKEVQRFFNRWPTIDPVAVLGTALFVVEGATLDRWLECDDTIALRQQFDQEFIEYSGISPEHHLELLALTMNVLPKLNRLRAAEIA